MPLVVPSVYRHIQSTPEETWTIVHNLSGNGSQGIPMVEVLWDDGNSLQKIIPSGIEVIDRNTVQVLFNSARAGQAIILV